MESFLRDLKQSLRMFAQSPAFTLAAVAGSLVGGRLASRLRPVVLTRTFAVLLVLVAGYTAARSLPALIG